MEEDLAEDRPLLGIPIPHARPRKADALPARRLPKSKTRLHYALDGLAVVFFISCVILGHKSWLRYQKQTSLDSVQRPPKGGPAERPLTAEKRRAPNIALVYVDDAGYNDFSPASSDLAGFTPRIAELAKQGMWFSNYYGMHVCTPSRAALMTGLYPIHTGMHHGIISGNDPWGLPLHYKIMPQYLQTLASYRTHMVGK